MSWVLGTPGRMGGADSETVKYNFNSFNRTRISHDPSYPPYLVAPGCNDFPVWRLRAYAGCAKCRTICQSGRDLRRSDPDRAAGHPALDEYTASNTDRASRALSPTETSTIPATLPPTTAPPLKPDYACDIANQRPLDDTTFERNQDFDIKWTIINTGTHRWEEGTYLEYQSGPEMTEIRRVDLPRLRPGEDHEVILDAVAPDELDRQIMVWAVQGPGAVRDSFYWMCYPYVRIVVEK